MKRLSNAELKRIQAFARGAFVPFRRSPKSLPWVVAQNLLRRYRIAEQGRKKFVRNTLPHGWFIDQDCGTPPDVFWSTGTCTSPAVNCLTSQAVPGNYLPYALAFARNPAAQRMLSYGRLRVGPCLPGGICADTAQVWKRGCGTPTTFPTLPADFDPWIRIPNGPTPELLPPTRPLEPALDPNLDRALPSRLKPGRGVDHDPKRDEDEQLRRTLRGGFPRRFRVVLRPPGAGGGTTILVPGVGTPVAVRKPIRDPKADIAFGPIAPSRPPRVGVRERKARAPATIAAKLWQVADRASEYCDFIDSIYSALPESRQTVGERIHDKIGGQFALGGCERKALQVYRHFDEVDLAQAVENILTNELEDQLIGRSQAAIQRGIGAQNAQKLTRIINVQGANLAPWLAEQTAAGYAAARRKASDAWKRYSR